jgi:hypothetical protein
MIVRHGTSDHVRSLVLSRESDSGAVRDYFGSVLVHEAVSGWPYHTPAMHFDHGWAHARLGCGVVLRRPSRTIYSPAIGALLPEDTCLDAQFIHWAMSSPCHFANAAAAAITDGFDAIVQIASKPTRVFGDVAETAQAEGRRIEQFHALDPDACLRVRAMKRHPPVPAAAVSAALQLEDHWWRVASEASPDPVTERICERLLQPLAVRKPFDIVSALADPLVDAIAVDRDPFARLLASSVLLLLKDDSIRRRLTSDPGLILAMVDATGCAAQPQAEQAHRARQAAASAVRTLLRLAPDFTALQPLGTVDLVHGKIPQLVITR